MVEEHSHMAAKYFDRWRQKSFGAKAIKHKSVTYCDRVQMLSPHLVKQNNFYYQVLQTSFNNLPMTIFIYNAYYDNRVQGKPAVRVITVTTRQIDVEKKKFWCLLWFDNLRPPVLSKVSEVYNIWPHGQVEPNTYGPQIVTCDIPPEYSNQLPQAISLQTVGKCSQMPREPSNILRVLKNDREPHFHPNRSIGICVQAFRFGAYDLSVRLVEWLELVRLMGADKVYFYVYGATDGMRQVLQHYRKEGLVDWTPMSLPGEQVNIETIYNYFYLQMHSKFWPSELIELNDCLYKNLYRHKYLAIIDIDEMIMPQTLNTWHEVLDKVESGLSEYDLTHIGNYLNRHAYVYDAFEDTQISGNIPIPSYLHMMRHTYRDQIKWPSQIPKSFQRTSLVYAAHNHVAMRCFNSTNPHNCNSLTINPEVSFLMHYRENVRPKCEDKAKCAIHDQTAWRYFDKLNETVQRQLWQIFGNVNN